MEQNRSTTQDDVVRKMEQRFQAKQEEQSEVKGKYMNEWMPTLNRLNKRTVQYMHF